MGVRCTPIFLFTKQTLEATQSAADLVYIDLGLDKVYQSLDLIVGKINTYQLFYSGDGIFLPLCGNILVVFDLYDDFFCFVFQHTFEIHRESLLII